MKKVNGIAQMVYEDRVLREYRDTLKTLGDCERAIHDALLIADGICLGGTYLGYEYDFNEAYRKLYAVYEYNKLEV